MMPEARDVATGRAWREVQLSPQNLFYPPKQFYLAVTSEFLLHFRPNWHQHNNKFG